MERSPIYKPNSSYVACILFVVGGGRSWSISGRVGVVIGVL